MAVQLGAKGQADFSQPIELLMDCHRRIEHFLGVLRRVADRYAHEDLDEQGREALTTALNYFKHAAPRHTADEEESLFPRMRQGTDPVIREAMAHLDRLEDDHRRVQAAHDRLEEIGRWWLSRGRLESAVHAEFDALLTGLAVDYDDHIRTEDERVFVLASRLLDDAALAQVGKEMQLRRQSDPGRDGSRCAERRKSNP